MLARRLILLGLFTGLLNGCAAIQTPPDNETSDAGASETAADSAEVRLPQASVIAELRVTGPEVPSPLEQPLPPAPYANAWDRLRAGFQLADHNDRLIQQHRDYFAQQPNYMRRVSERARPWVHYILNAIERRDMPTELALVPVVESAFRPFAYSSGRASGIWQIVPGTARHLGLERNWWYEGRRDVIAATDAALDYLERLGGRFDGDWLLALAAYNAGEGTVLRAMEQNQKAGERTDFWHLDLPTETERYVPRILALRDLINNPTAYGLSGLPKLPNEPGIAIVDMEHQIDLARAADMAGLDIDRLYRLNPGFNRWATPPDGPHRLVVPVDQAKRFREALAAAEPDERMQWRRHEVASGETLLGIADAYDTSARTIREANDINGNIIHAGQDLIVPVASGAPEDYRLSATQRLSQRNKAPRNGERDEYTVRQGDSFWSIARRFDVGVRELASWNGMSPGDTLRPGDELIVWADAPVTQSARDTNGSGPTGDGEATQYKVRKGDSLWTIARRFDVNVGELARWNGLSTEATLRPGDELSVWTEGAGGADRSTEAERAASNRRLARYTVRQGDSLYHIAREHDVTVTQLRRWNDIAPESYLQPGQTLRMELDRESDS